MPKASSASPAEKIRIPMWARRIKDARNTLGWNQQDLADQIGVSQKTVSDWETGKHNIPPDRWQKVSDVTGLPIWQLMPDNAEIPIADLVDTRRRVFDALYNELARLAQEDFDSSSSKGLNTLEFAYMAHLGASRVWLSEVRDSATLQKLISSEALALRQTWQTPDDPGLQSI